MFGADPHGPAPFCMDVSNFPATRDGTPSFVVYRSKRGAMEIDDKKLVALLFARDRQAIELMADQYGATV